MHMNVKLKLERGPVFIIKTLTHAVHMCVIVKAIRIPTPRNFDRLRFEFFFEGWHFQWKIEGDAKKIKSLLPYNSFALTFFFANQQVIKEVTREKYPNKEQVSSLPSRKKNRIECQPFPSQLNFHFFFHTQFLCKTRVNFWGG
jgi:hypothetical protein